MLAWSFLTFLWTGLLCFGMLGSATALAQDAAPAPTASAAPDFAHPGRVKVATEELIQNPAPGIELRFAPGSELLVRLTTRVKLNGSRDNPTKLYAIELISGRVSVSIPPASGPNEAPETTLIVYGPGKTAALPMGGKAIVIVRGTEMTVANLDGNVLAAMGNEWKPIPSGNSRVFIGGRQGPTTALLGSTNFELTPRLLLAAASDPGMAEVKIRPVSGAASYRIDLWRVTDSGRRAVKQHLVKAPLLRLDDLVPGRYAITVLALSAAGLEGKPTPEQELRVIGIELPPGVRQVDGAILLLPRQRVRLLEGEGLRMTYGDGSSYFVPAPKDFGLGRLSETTARFRTAEGSAEARLVLRRRPYAAEIQVGIPGLRSPPDRVEVVLNVTDMQGHARPKALERQVLLDGKPQRVEWWEEDGTSKAWVRLPAGAGPWQLQIRCSDALGAVAEVTEQVQAACSASGCPRSKSASATPHQ